jgi:hypothetical protein
VTTPPPGHGHRHVPHLNGEASPVPLADPEISVLAEAAAMIGRVLRSAEPRHAPERP